MARRTTQTARTSGPMIDPKQWRIIGPFQYKGISYSRGEPVPKMPVAEARRLMAQGKLSEDAVAEVAESDTGDVRSALGRAPQSPEDYLKGTDIMVLRRIRGYKPEPGMLRNIEQVANRHGRSRILVEALRALLGDSL